MVTSSTRRLFLAGALSSLAALATPALGALSFRRRSIVSRHDPALWLTESQLKECADPTGAYRFFRHGTAATPAQESLLLRLLKHPPLRTGVQVEYNLTAYGSNSPHTTAELYGYYEHNLRIAIPLHMPGHRPHGVYE